jgi:hypothetical protein
MYCVCLLCEAPRVFVLTTPTLLAYTCCFARVLTRPILTAGDCQPGYGREWPSVRLLPGRL